MPPAPPKSASALLSTAATTRTLDAASLGSGSIDWINARSPEHRLAVLALAEAAATKAPDDPHVQLLLGGALIDAGRIEQALARLSGAHRRFQAHAPLAAALARTLGSRGEIEAALAILENWRTEAWAARASLSLLAKHRRFGEAEAFEEPVAAADPADPALIESRARRLRSQPEAMLGMCDAALAHDPGATHALYYKAIALAQLGRVAEAQDLMALERFVAIAQVPAPPGFATATACHNAVREEILANPTLRPDADGHATRNGLRTAKFPLAGDAASIALIRSIEDAAKRYADGLRGEHPFVAARPARATFTAWALVFRETGHQVAHHHPEPWMTGVYYVAAPAGRPRPGAIRIGLFPDWAGVEPPWPVLTVEPEPGRLILFPSFVPHATVPSGSAEERISIAFDVAAARASGRR